MSEAKAIAHLRLCFDPEKAEAAHSLSAIEQVGDTLWLGGDESAALDSLRTRDWSNYVGHQCHELRHLFKELPDARGEVDLEGLAADGPRLWLIGSHSQRRGQPEVGSTGDAVRKALRVKKVQPNRFLLGCVDLQADAEGRLAPVAGSGRSLPFTHIKALDPDDECPVNGNVLTECMSRDKLLAPFLSIPSKDNGFDVEGLAVSGDRLYLGLRGPVLRGWALILQLRPRLRSSKVALDDLDGKRPYLCHALDLSGLGIRDLALDGDDLWILAGPTMSLDGPMRVFRWRGCLSEKGAQCVDDRRLEWCLDLPIGRRSDHAEGITLFRPPGETRPSLLVVYDTPAAGRFHGGRYYEADLFRLP